MPVKFKHVTKDSKISKCVNDPKAAQIFGFFRFDDDELFTAAPESEWEAERLNEKQHRKMLEKAGAVKEVNDVFLWNMGNFDLSDDEPFDRDEVKKGIAGLVKFVKDRAFKKITLDITNFVSGKCFRGDCVLENIILEDIVHAFSEAYYKYSEVLSDEIGLTVNFVNRYTGLDRSETYEAITRSAIIAEAVNEARHLGDLPANICTPEYLHNAAIDAYLTEIRRKHKKAKKQDVPVDSSLSFITLEKEHIENEAMGSFLAVAKGSSQDPYFTVLEYCHPECGGSDPVVIIGKGITFDSGGISIKPAAKMNEMKYDMCGAAAVIATMHAVAKLKLKVAVVALIPTCENLLNGEAVKPGDVVTSMSGKTIEILNTDAEGRLILCDAITYAQEHYNPAMIIDIATLTGACAAALGSHYTGLFTNNDTLANGLMGSAETVDEKMWRLPMTKEYDEQLSSKFADIPNLGSPGAGASVAACFLARFVEKDIPYAHLDIAGTAWNSNGATGVGVKALVEFLMTEVSSTEEDDSEEN
jgi:leucyl aminopeptidase